MEGSRVGGGLGEKIAPCLEEGGRCGSSDEHLWERTFQNYLGRLSKPRCLVLHLCT